eukprot:scaffold69_cov248-Pinguiococcus_pyrenoidosus.AAC.47
MRPRPSETQIARGWRNCFDDTVGLNGSVHSISSRSMLCAWRLPKRPQTKTTASDSDARQLTPPLAPVAEIGSRSVLTKTNLEQTSWGKASSTHIGRSFAGASLPRAAVDRRRAIAEAHQHLDRPDEIRVPQGAQEGKRGDPRARRSDLDTRSPRDARRAAACRHTLPQMLSVAMRWGQKKRGRKERKAVCV